MFENSETLDELKRIYRKCCKLLHPDLGGDAELMQLCNEEYEAHKLKLENRYKKSVIDEEFYKKQNFYGPQHERFVVFENLQTIREVMKPHEEEFISSVFEYFIKNGYITEKQIEALEGLLNRLKWRYQKTK